MRALLAGRDNVRTFLGGDRRYTVTGHLTFQLKTGAEPDLAELRQAIVVADRSHPWKDDDSDQQFKSIGELTAGHKFTVRYRIQMAGCTDHFFWFDIKPGYNKMRKGQVYAYETYLAALARELSQMALADVIGVTSTIKMQTGRVHPAS